MPTLLLMRHAQAAESTPGRGDRERPLTEAGLEQARRVGEQLRRTGERIDLVVCSAALRTRQTAEALAVECPTQETDAVYEAGADTIRAVIAEVADDVDVLLVLGHAPGIPGLAHDLVAMGSADSAARQAVDSGFPTATVCRFTVPGPWSELDGAELTDTWLQRPG